MRVSIRELYLQQQREAYRVSHERNLKELERLNCQVKEANNKQAAVQPKPSINSVDVRV